MQVEYALLLNLVDRSLIDVWVQVIVPPFTALFASSGAYFEFFFQFVRYKGPFARPVLLHQLYDGIVLLSNAI